MVIRNLIFSLAITVVATVAVSLAGCAETDTPMVGRHRAMFAEDKGELEEAIKIRKDLITRFPNYLYLPDIHFEQAETYLSMNLPAKAVTQLNNAINLDAEFKEAFQLRSKAHYQLGNFSQAIEDSDQAILLAKDESLDIESLYLTRGDAFAEAGATSEALHNWQRANLLEPEAVSPLLRLADYYSEVGEWDQSIDYLDQAVKKESKNPELHFQRSLLLVKLDRKEEAQTALETARELDSENSFQFPNSLDELMQVNQTKVEGEQKPRLETKPEPEQESQYEHVTAKPSFVTGSLLEEELLQAKNVVQDFLKTEDIKYLTEPAEFANAILCEENELRFPIIIKVIKEKNTPTFELTAREYNLIRLQSSPVGMIVVSEIKFDPETGAVDQKSGRVIAFAKNWKPILSRIQPSKYNYQMPKQP